MKETLEINVITTPLRELVLNIRKKERATARKVDHVKRVRRLAGEMGLIKEATEPLPKRPRRTQGGEEKSVQGTQSLPPVINPNMEGIIKISPSTLWYSLSEDDKTFILNYNRAIRHNEEKPELPKGVTIGEKQNRSARRVRRAKASDYFEKDGNDDAKEEPNATVPQEEQEAPAAKKDNTSKDDIDDDRKLSSKEQEDDSSVGSIGSIEEGNLSLNPALRKKVTFHLHGGDNEANENEEVEEEDEEPTADDSPRRSPRLIRRRVRRNRQAFTIVNNNDDDDADEDETYIPDPAMPALERRDLESDDEDDDDDDDDEPSD